MPSSPTTSRSTRIRPAILLVTTILTLSAVLFPRSPSSPRLVLAATTLHVSPTGSDTTGTGTSSKPWKTIQKAADEAAAGDTIVVRPGTYPDAVEISLRGTAAAPITFRAEGLGVVLDASDVDRDAVLITESAYVVWEGFRIQDAPRAGLRVSSSHHVTVRRNTFAENGTWGLFTDFSDDLLIEGNESFGADREHGIYHSNSGDRPVIRNNVIHDNYANGIHMNGDLSMGGDGVITGALVEGNLIYGNGRGGGSGINMDGVEASVIRNNVIYDTHASGISMYQIDGGVCSRNNLVQHNTVVVASDGRWAVNIPDSGCTGNRLESNILHSDHGYRGAINVVQGARSGFVSDHNVLEGRFTTDDGDSILTLAQWQSLGYDTHSVVSTPAALFVNPAGDLHLKPGSPAIDAGRTLPSVTRDRDGNARPQGARSDAGAYESPGAAPAATCTLTPATAKVGDRLTLACRRFGPAESVAVTWDGAPLTAFSTDATGGGTATLTVPRTTAGPHTLKLRGAQSGKTNTKRPTVVPSVGLSPRSAAPGATVRVTLRGFAAGETVTLRLRTAPRSSRTVRAGIVASASGTASTSFVVPTGSAGRYTVEAAGSTGVLASSPFTRTSSPAASSTDDPTATVSPTATPTASPTASPSTTATPFASPTPSPTMTATSTPAPTTTPIPVPATQTPTPPSPPTETPTPESTTTPTLSQPPTASPAA